MPTAAKRACPVCGVAGCGVHERRSVWAHREPTKRYTGTTNKNARRQLFAKQPWCVACLRHDRYVLATIRDHIVPLAEGGAESVENTQPLCVACHDIKSQAEAQRGRSLPGGVPRIVVVTGVPGSGKTSYVQRHRTPGDLVWDFDAIAGAVAQMPTWPRPAHVTGAVLAMRAALVEYLRLSKRSAFLIISSRADARSIAKDLNASLVQCGGAQGP